MRTNLRRALLAAVAAAIVGVSPYEAPPRRESIIDLPPAVVLPVGEPMPLLAARR